MFRHLIVDATMSTILSDRQFEAYKDYRFWMGIISAVVLVICLLSIFSFNDDTLIRPKLEKEFTKNNYAVQLTHKDGKNNLKCVSKETGGIVIVSFYNSGAICDISYALPVDDVYMTDKNIREFKKHIDSALGIVSRHKGKLKKAEKYPAVPINNECFQAYSENIKKSYQKTSVADGYDFRYEYLGDEGDNAIFYYYTEIKG